MWTLLVVMMGLRSAGVGLEPVSVGVSPETGQWAGLTVGGLEIAVRPGAQITAGVDGHDWPGAGDWRLVEHEVEAGATHVTRRAGNWETHESFVPTPAGLERRARLVWQGAEPVRVRWIRLHSPVLWISRDPDDRYVLPGPFPVLERRTGELEPGRSQSEPGWTRADYGIGLLVSERRSRALFVGWRQEWDNASLAVDESADGVSFAHRFDTAVVLAPGMGVDTGVQVFGTARGRGAEVVSALGSFTDGLGNGPPSDLPPDHGQRVLYEAHPWGRLESWWLGDQGNRYPRITSLLSRYSELGVTTLWLLPVSWAPPWVYTLPRFDRIDPGNGTAEELRDLVDRAHALDMKVLIDLVVYGIRPDSDQVSEFPDSVWCVDENGERRVVWGGTVLAADVSHPAWQERISEVVRSWARDFGFDGTRLDCAGAGQAQNWGNPDRANAAVSRGGLELNRVIRDTMREVNPGAVTMPEGGKATLFRNADMVFDYPLYMALRDMTWAPDRGRWVADLRDWLRWEQASYPRRALPGLVRFLENHDTVAAARYWGVGPSQALMALCCFLEGTPLFYQEQETGFAPEIASWLFVRRSHACFQSGVSDYTGVEASHPEVLAFMRVGSEQAAVVAINLSPRNVALELSWSRDLATRFPRVFDAFTGEPLGNGVQDASLRIPAFRPRVLILGAADAESVPVPPEPVAGASGVLAFEQEAEGNGLRISVPTAHHWFVHTGEGVLSGPFDDCEGQTNPGTERVSLLPVLKRAWNPLEQGMLDVAGGASMGFRDAEGRSVRVVLDPDRVASVRIDEPCLQGRDAAVIVSPDNAVVGVDGQWGADGIEFERTLRAGPVQAVVTPQRVRLANAHLRLDLARRHGGVPMALSLEAGDEGTPVWLAGSDLYTDWGLFERGLYVSADGETNPRLDVRVEGEDEALCVTFRGRLHRRSWNGIQTCPPAGPDTRYRISYTMDQSARVRVEMAVIPAADQDEASAFFALRLPMPPLVSWVCGADSGTRDDLGSGRLGQEASFTTPLFAELKGGARFVVTPDPGALQRLFLLPGGRGSGLFAALLDGDNTTLRRGSEVKGAFTFQVSGP